MTPEDEYHDQDAEPTGTAGGGRPQDQPTPSEPGEPDTNVEAEKGADEDARLTD
ncbi:MAG TPA: hypothetical protein VK640_10165 [Actinomycetes bacterium]|nr:hypothetical protein [Actinomycetes bacterium]